VGGRATAGGNPGGRDEPWQRVGGVATGGRRGGSGAAERVIAAPSNQRRRQRRQVRAALAAGAAARCGPPRREVRTSLHIDPFCVCPLPVLNLL